MAWVRFTAPFDFTPAAQRQVTVAYRGGAVANVTRECAAAAIAAGAAEETAGPETRDQAALANAVRDGEGPVADDEAPFADGEAD